MVLQLLQQVLLLMIFVLIYIAGGYIANQTKEELTIFKKYVDALVVIAAAVILGLIVFNSSNIYAGLLVGIGFFLLGKLMHKYMFYFIILILSGAIIFQSNRILGAAVVMILMQGIIDYNALKKETKIKAKPKIKLNADKKSKTKSSKMISKNESQMINEKYDLFLIKVIQIIMIPLFILGIYTLLI